MPFRSALFLKIAINSFVKKVVQDLTSGGSDPCIVVIVHDKHRFLSTLPARGATERLSPSLDTIRFLSTLPARGATGTKENFKMIEKISIHAPREGSDEMPRRRKRRPWDFYPRSPRGERQQKQRGKSLLLFHYTTLCTNLEELFSQKGKNWENSCKGDLPYWCEGNEKTMGTSPSHGLAGEG